MEGQELHRGDAETRRRTGVATNEREKREWEKEEALRTAVAL